jgi:hypothetical protein
LQLHKLDVPWLFLKIMLQNGNIPLCSCSIFIVFSVTLMLQVFSNFSWKTVVLKPSMLFPTTFGFEMPEKHSYTNSERRLKSEVRI